MRKYADLTRTTIGEYMSKRAPVVAGVYVIACYPAYGCIYIGISNDIWARVFQHLISQDDIGVFMRNNMAVACSWRIDVLHAPDASREWMIEAERMLIQHYHPLLNTQHLGE